MKQGHRLEMLTEKILEESDMGFMCPRCRFPMKVYRTKKLTKEISRERICLKCKKKIITEETLMK